MKIKTRNVMSGVLLGLIALTLPGLVEAISIKKLAAKIAKNGREHTIPEPLAAELALARSVPTKYEEVDDTQTKDETYRVVFLFPAENPEGFIFMTKRIKGYRYEQFYIRTDLTGAPKAGFVEYGEIYPDGTLTRDPKISKRFIAKDATLASRLPDELDFWLQGRGRFKKVNPFEQADPGR